MTDYSDFAKIPVAGRNVFCNRTLNLKAISAIGFDMDYTLIHYKVSAWEGRAFHHLRERLVGMGWPAGDVEFEPNRFPRGLVIDLELGNLVKANRFGVVKQAEHGTRTLAFDELRRTYGRVFVDLAETRWVLMTTFFAQSEALMYASMVDHLDKGDLPAAIGYAELYKRVKQALDSAHMEGQLKTEILSNPDGFVDLDPDLPRALLDMVAAGRKLLLITNSDWAYTAPMMEYAFDRFLPDGQSWRDLFEIVIVSARKPDFFTRKMPLFRVTEPDDPRGLLEQAFRLDVNGVFVGGSASQVEECLELEGEAILYVGDHILSDVHVTKDVMRWRTALVLRELEDELIALEAFAPAETELAGLMAEKERLEHIQAQARLGILRKRREGETGSVSPARLYSASEEIKARLVELDARIAPLARASAKICNPIWGPLLRAGNDKSLLARQLEQSADIYMSRVSNLLYVTPYGYLRAPRGCMPHDDPATRHHDPEA